MSITHFTGRLCAVAALVLLSFSCCLASMPPICPHVLGWNSAIGAWAKGAPWIKVIYSGDIANAKAAGAKVFYRPWDADSANHDDGCLPASLTGAQYADLVWARISSLAQKPEAIGYRNEFNWTDPAGSVRTCQQFPSYASRLKTLGYTGQVIFGSFGVGWIDDATWNDPDLTAAVAASDGVETHEYFDLQVNCGAPWYAFRHRDIAIANHAYLQSKDWFIGEFGSDRCCSTAFPCSDSLCRRGWRDNGKLTERAYIDQMGVYRQGCANQVKAVFVFQQGDSGPWLDFEVMGTNVAEWMRSTWGLPSGRFVGQVTDTRGNPIAYPVISVTPGLYGAASSFSNGGYASPSIPAGTYSITVSHAGYASKTVTGQVIIAGKTTSVPVSLSPISSIADAKKQPNDTTAAVSGIVTARFPLTGSPDRIYLQDANRVSAIAVFPASTAAIADVVQAQGTVYTTPDGERAIKDASVTNVQSGVSLPKSLGMSNLWLGGGQFGLQDPVLNQSPTLAYAKGLSNIGLVVHAWGKVSFVDSAKAYFYLNDGSGIEDGSGHPGIRVAVAGLPAPPDSANVDVIGISSTMTIGGKIVRLLRPRSISDLSYAATSNCAANPGFENGMAGWTTYGRADGAQTGTWFGNVSALSGSAFFGNAANWDAKAGGAYQRVMALDGGSYQARVWSRVYWSGNSSSSVQSRVGIDPLGGTNPTAGSIAWSNWDIQPAPDTSRWAQLVTPTVTCSGGMVTIFLDFTQANPAGWHVNCFDDAEVKLSR